MKLRWLPRTSRSQLPVPHTSAQLFAGWRQPLVRPRSTGRKMLPAVCLALGAYWGPGFEDLSLGRRVSVGLRGQAVDADVQTAIGKDDPQTFDWLAYYEVGGLMRAMANTEQFDPEPLLSGKPRVDAVQQGYFMIYNATTLADFDMKDHFFSITLDLAKHTEYEAHGVAPNCTLRFVVFESEPNVVSVKGSNIVLDGSFVGEEDAAKYQDGAGAFNRVLRSTEELEQHFSLTWGFETDPATGAPRAPCRKAVDQLWIGVQCIRGYATEPCTPLGTTATKYDDCNTYCPYTLTARAVPRALKHGDAVESLIGPGQWQLFEVDAGKYDLVEVTIERDEFDEATYPYAWQDGLTGGAWLAHRTCVQPNVTRRKSDLECQLFGICGPDDALEPFICPYGHPQAVDHPLCSPELNVTYEVAVANGSWVRAATVDPQRRARRPRVQRQPRAHRGGGGGARGGDALPDAARDPRRDRNPAGERESPRQLGRHAVEAAVEAAAVLGARRRRNVRPRAVRVARDGAKLPRRALHDARDADRV